MKATAVAIVEENGATMAVPSVYSGTETATEVMMAPLVTGKTEVTTAPPVMEAKRAKQPEGKTEKKA